MKAYWNDQLIAESNDTIIVEGNHYFPADAIHQEHAVGVWQLLTFLYRTRVPGE